MKLDMKLENVAADGACFFRAVANGLKGKKLDYDTQTKVVDEIKKNIIKYLTKYPNQMVYSEYDFQTYKNKLMKLSYWGGYFEAYIISLCYDVTISIYSQKLKKPETFQSSGSTISLYHCGTHYQRILNDPSVLRKYYLDSNETQYSTLNYEKISMGFLMIGLGYVIKQQLL